MQTGMNYRFLSASIFALLAVGCGASESALPPPEQAPLGVRTDKGAVQGAIVGSTRAFLGIPFAAPPVDALRWKPPAPHQPWKETLSAIYRRTLFT